MGKIDRRSGYWNREKETMPAAACRRYQEAWLLELVALAWERAPGVRRRLEAARLRPQDLSSLDALARLPVIKKSQMPDLQQAAPPFGGFCTVPMRRVRKIFVSPGPIFEPLGPEVGGWHAEVGLYAGGFRPGDIVLNTYAYHLTPAAQMIDEALNVIGCAVVPTGVGNTDYQVTIGKAVGATGYVGTPSFLMTILKRAEEMGVGRLPLEVAEVGAEALPESLRRTFEEQYGILTRQGFGTADIGLVAYECVEKSGMHLVEDAIVQVCDPQTGEPLANGQIGELVATVRHETYPMIRFGTGDLTIINDSPCPCGRTSARMLGWRGRADEVTKVRGMFIHPRQADEVAARAGGLVRYQVVVTRRDHQDVMTFRVELAEGAEAGAVKPALEAAIRDVMKLRGEVEVVLRGSIPESAKKIDDQRKWD
ncbi:MAG: phenylacetate--CoA ligase family protein [Candidatus Rokubacteria bacterium]|nr:phenylacetate--CoA ligase family protein [Candidatus Rokubacteria bacterium]